MPRRITSAADVRELLPSYERIFNPRELVDVLIQAASAVAPEELAAVLPDKWLQQIRTQTASPPENRSDVLFAIGGTFRSGFDHEAYCAEMSRTWFDGARNWNRYFAERSTAPDQASPMNPLDGR